MAKGVIRGTKLAVCIKTNVAPEPRWWVKEEEHTLITPTQTKYSISSSVYHWLYF
jgi:hypothetical protein